MKYTPGRCADCGHDRPWLHKHHIIPKSQGGSNGPENLVGLCANCHEDRHEGLLGGGLGNMPESRAKAEAKLRVIRATPEYRQSHSDGLRRYYANWTPEEQESLSQKRREMWEREGHREQVARKISETKRGGKWAKDHVCCVSCGTTATKHEARGLCKSCYGYRKNHR